MKKILLILVLFTACNREIETPNGKVKIDHSFKQVVNLVQVRRTYVKEEIDSCTKCGLCYSFMSQGFTFNCFCTGEQNVTREYCEADITYKYYNNKQSFIAKPVRSVTSKILKTGDCN